MNIRYDDPAGTGPQSFERASDPTALTTAQLLREVGNLKVHIEEVVAGLQAVTDVRFSALEAQLAAMERQRIELKNDTEKAMHAAFDAAKEAVLQQATSSDKAISKAEAATVEQFKQLNLTRAATVQAAETVINDLKERIVKIESHKQGSKDLSNLGMAVAGLLLTAIVVALTVYAAVHK